MDRDPHPAFVLRSNGERIGLDYTESGLFAPGLTEDEGELVAAVDEALSALEYTIPRDEPITIATHLPVTHGELVTAAMLEARCTPPRRDVVELVARGWALGQYHYPLGRLTELGASGLAAARSLGLTG